MDSDLNRSDSEIEQKQSTPDIADRNSNEETSQRTLHLENRVLAHTEVADNQAASDSPDLEEFSSVYDEINAPRIRYQKDSAEYLEILQKLDSTEEVEILQTLKELCTNLSVAQEDIIYSFPMDQFLVKLLDWLELSSIPEIPLYAINWISHLLDIHPTTRERLVASNGVRILCGKLSNLEFIDMAEKSVQILEKLSVENGAFLLQEGVFCTITTILDFFELTAQKSAYEVLTNILRSVASLDDLQDNVLPILGQYVGYLQYRSSDFLCVNEKVVLFFKVLVERTQMLCSDESEEQIWTDKISSLEIIPKLLELIPLAQSINCSIYKLLTALLRRSSTNLRTFYDHAGIDIVKNLLGSKKNMNGHQLEKFLFLNSLLPKRLLSRQVDMNKIDYYSENTGQLHELAVNILAYTLSNFISMQPRSVKIIAWKWVSKLVTHLPKEMLESIINSARISEFLIAVLSYRDSPLLTIGLNIIQDLYTKVSGLISEAFVRQGVIGQVSKLVNCKITNTEVRPRLFARNAMENMFTLRFQRSRSELLEPPLIKKRSTGRDVQQLATETLSQIDSTTVKSATLQQLKNISKQLMKEEGNQIEVLAETIENGVTVFEFRKSKIVDALCFHLFSPNCKQKKRVQNFISTFIDKNAILPFVSLLQKTLSANKNFQADSAQSLASRKSLIRLSFDRELSEFPHVFFESSPAMEISVNTTQKFSSIFTNLWHVSSQGELHAYTSGLGLRRFITLPHESPPPSIAISIDGQQVLLSSTVSQYLSAEQEGEALDVNFWFTIDPSVVESTSSHSILYIDDTDDMVRYLTSRSNETGTPENSTVAKLLRLLKFMYLANGCARFFGYTRIDKSRFLNKGIESRQDKKLLFRGKSLYSEGEALMKHCGFLFAYEKKLAVLRDSCKPLLARRPIRQKITVPRNQVLSAAKQIMGQERYRKDPVDIEYYDEEGMGLGPTLEFYALVSQQIRALEVWRNDGEETGLFPRPWNEPNVNSLETLEFIGSFVGKAIQDGRLADLSLSPALWKLVLRRKVDFHDLRHVDASIYRFLCKIKPGSPQVLSKMLGEMQIYFVVPGYDNVLLTASGDHIAVTCHNVDTYIRLVSQRCLCLTSEIAAFRKGLWHIIDIEKLEPFTESELDRLLWGIDGEQWSYELLSETVHPAHGYTRDDATYANLLRFMLELDGKEKRRFLSFITGTPRLPAKGIAGLTPPLTVVRKDPAYSTENADGYLPSAMTWQNYLKLPNYSSYQVLKERLEFAYREGCGSFHLS